MNNYRGYLLKFGGVTMPNNYFLEYTSTPNRRSEASAETDQIGRLIRDTLPHKRTTVKFTTHMMNLDNKINFQNIIARGLVNELKREHSVEYWNDETNSYYTGVFYIPDVEYTIQDASATDIKYNPITVEIIEN